MTFVRRTLCSFVAVTLVLSLSGVATAQERRIQAFLYDNGPDLQLDYAWSDCPWECQVVIFDCAEGLLRVVLVDLAGPQIADWFDFHDETPKFPTAQLILDGDPTQLNFLHLKFGDLNGAWWVEMFRVRYNGDDWLTQFGTANRIAIETPVLALDLPWTPADLDRRAAFADACRAM